MIRDGEHTFTWSHSAHRRPPRGPVAGHAQGRPLREHQDLALLTDRRRPRSEAARHPPRHRATPTAFDDWWSYAREAYMDLGGDAPPQIGHPLLRPAARRAPQAAGDGGGHQRAVPRAAAAGRRPPALRRRARHARRARRRRRRPSSASGSPAWRCCSPASGASTTRPSASAAGAEASYEPTWDRERGEFTWGFGLGEEHPRGQFNAIMAAAEAVTPGAWTRPGERRRPPAPPARSSASTSRPSPCARPPGWTAACTWRRRPMNDAVVGAPTSWRVTGLDDPARWTATDARRCPGRAAGSTATTSSSRRSSATTPTSSSAADSA